MNIFEISSLFIIMLTLALVPSASVALVVTRSVMLGVSNGVAVSLGIVFADLIFITLVVFGLSVVAESMGWLFITIKYIGAIYLLWIGITLLRTNQETIIDVSKSDKNGSIIASFFAGLFLTLGDIKAIFFYVSLLPTFISLESLELMDTITIILITIITVGGTKIFYAFSARKVVALSQGYNYGTGFKKIAGVFMLGAGGYLIVKA